MADDTKRYFWIKLTDDFLFGPELKYVLQQKNGYAYALLYEMICARFKNTDGKLIDVIHDIYIKYDETRLAKEFAQYFEHDTVILATVLFKQMGLIREDIDGIMYIPEYGSLIGSETEAARRKRRQRADQKDRLLMNQSQQFLPSEGGTSSRQCPSKKEEHTSTTPQKEGGTIKGQCPNDTVHSVSSIYTTPIEVGQCPPICHTESELDTELKLDIYIDRQSDGQCAPASACVDTPAPTCDAELEFYRDNLHEHIKEIFDALREETNVFHNYVDMISDSKIININSMPHKAAEILDIFQYYCTPSGRDEFYKVLTFAQQKISMGEVANEFNYTVAALYNNARNHGATSNVRRI